MLAIDSATDAFWRLRTERIETGWHVFYVQVNGEEWPVGDVVADGHVFTVWFEDGVALPISLADFDTAIDCLRDYADASHLGLRN